MNNQHGKLLILNQYITHLEKPNFSKFFSYKQCVQLMCVNSTIMSCKYMKTVVLARLIIW